MKKVLAVICLLAVLAALIVKGCFAFFEVRPPTGDKDGFITRSEVSYDSSGQETGRVETKVKLVRINNLITTEGAELLVTAEGLTLKSSPGTLYYEKPIVGQAEAATWWLLLGVNLSVGLYLLRKEA